MPYLTQPSPPLAGRSTPPRTPRRSLLAGAAALLALALPASADAMTAAKVGTTLSITDHAAHAAVVTIGDLDNPLSLPGSTSSPSAPTAPSTAPSRLQPPHLIGLLTDPNTLVCDHSAFDKIAIDLADGHDQVLTPTGLTILGASVLPLGSERLDLTGGAGNDLLTAARSTTASTVATAVTRSSAAAGTTSSSAAPERTSSSQAQARTPSTSPGSNSTTSSAAAAPTRSARAATTRSSAAWSGWCSTSSTSS